MVKSNFLKLAGFILLSLAFTSCATQSYNERTTDELRASQENQPYFKTFNSNWIRHES